MNTFVTFFCLGLKHKTFPFQLYSLWMDTVLPLSTFCSKNGIELVALYPNATHVLQPLDVADFHTMKLVWRQIVLEWRMNHDERQVGIAEFPQVLKEVLPSVTSTIIQNGFKNCGLVPGIIPKLA